MLPPCPSSGPFTSWPRKRYCVKSHGAASREKENVVVEREASGKCRVVKIRPAVGAEPGCETVTVIGAGLTEQEADRLGRAALPPDEYGRKSGRKTAKEDRGAA